MPNSTKYSSMQMAMGGWTDYMNLGSSDLTYANTESPGGTVDLTSFSFNIPTDATIDGLILEGLGYQSSAMISCSDCQLLQTSIPIGTNKNGSFPTITSGSPGENITVGSSNDLWGYALTPSIINDLSFGIRIGFTVTSGTYYFDYFRLNVYYSTIGGGTILKRRVSIGMSAAMKIGKRSAMKGIL